MEKSIIKIVNMSFKYKKEYYLFRNFNLEAIEHSYRVLEICRRDYKNQVKYEV